MAAICRSTIIKEGTPFTSEWSLRSLRNSHAVYVGIYIPFISEWLRRSAGICMLGGYTVLIKHLEEVGKMKWNRWIIKAAKIITKFTELGYWMTAALMLTAGIYSFADRTFLADALAGSIRTDRLELSVLGFEFSVPTANGIDMRAMLLYFVAAIALPSLMAMIFRNLYLIIKRSESSTVFQADNIRMLREIGIFAISIPLAGLALSIVCRLILGTDTVETSVRLYGFSMGLVILCLTQFFARGVELEQDVEGLV